MLFSLTAMTPFNIVEKVEELLYHSAFTESKIHLQLFKKYINDDEIYKDRIEKYLSITLIIINDEKYTELEYVLIVISLDLLLFDEILNIDEKKMLVMRVLDIIDFENNGEIGKLKFIVIQEFLITYRLFYNEQLFNLGLDSLKNFEILNELSNVVDHYTNILRNEDQSIVKLLDTPRKFYNQKKKYFEDKYSIEKEKSITTGYINDSINDNYEEEHLKELKKIWLATAKISIHDFIDIGVNNHIWDEDYRIISKRGNLYGSGKSLLSSLSIALKNYAIPEIIDYKIVGSAFCKAFNIKNNENTKEKYKAFSSGNPEIIKEFKRLYKI